MNPELSSQEKNRLLRGLVDLLPQVDYQPGLVDYQVEDRLEQRANSDFVRQLRRRFEGLFQDIITSECRTFLTNQFQASAEIGLPKANSDLRQEIFFYVNFTDDKDLGFFDKAQRPGLERKAFLKFVEMALVQEGVRNRIEEEIESQGEKLPANLHEAMQADEYKVSDKWKSQFEELYGQPMFAGG